MLTLTFSKIKLTFALLTLTFTLPAMGKVKLKQTTPQTTYAASLLGEVDKWLNITVSISGKGQPEGFTLRRRGKDVAIVGNDGSGCIYGANRLLDELQADPTLAGLTTLTDAPQMVMRGACVGLQKTEYLPGHSVYEYPYTPENFPWFYDKALWIRYLDLLASCNMNTLYLWNGHPFASLVKLPDYPFAPEVDDKTMQLNQEMFSFLVDEADRRGIRVIQMFYNIIVSKPFADHYGIKTQDRNRPITPLIADYTRKSIAAFVEQYPKVGFLICLGEAMSGLDNDIKWMTEVVIPGIRDGLQASGRTDTPPIILRNHDTDGPAVLKVALPLYPNIYTMNKYTGESLTTYEPGGSWGETHRRLAAAAPVHIDNVHILANLEPWRWASPAFIRKTVQAMHRVHHAKGLHLYPQASYWDWPYTADRLPTASLPQRLLQIDRDWLWYKAWGRYAFSGGCDSVAATTEADYWTRVLASHYGLPLSEAGHLLTAFDEMGEIAPKLLRRFGITEGNRQTLLLGMTMAQLVNPYKFNVYPGFYESCGPVGEKLIDYVEREHKGLPHVGELPLDIVAQCVEHGRKASDAFDRAVQSVAVLQQPTERAAELRRLGNDIACYALFALSFERKVKAAEQVLRYKWTKDIRHLENAVPLLEESVALWRVLAALTDETYLYANSMQTAQRRIPVGGDGGRFKTWRDMLPVYEQELVALKANIEKLKHPVARPDVLIKPAQPAPVTILSPHTSSLSPLQKGTLLFENRTDTPVDSLAPELEGLQALVLNRDTTRIVGTTVAFECRQSVKMLVGFFQDDDPKWARPPKLETDATGNEYGQAEPLLTNAIAIEQMPKVNIHAYSFPAGRHTLHLPKGILLVAGFTSDDIKPRDCALNGPSNEVDWLFHLSSPRREGVGAVTSSADSIPPIVMQAVYDEVRTPYKYGLVVAPTDNFHKFDCPTVFREGDKWLMTYVCYDGKDGTDGRGYETWLAESDDLLHWTTKGRILSLPPTTQGRDSWDMNQRGGFPALIGIALSDDMKHWRRYEGNPVFANRKYNAFNTFAVSRDLIHWQPWDGPDLIVPSKPYDEMFAHKSCVVKHDGVVYHFYCAVNNSQQRGIAVATSRKMGRSDVRFSEPEPVGKRRLVSLNENWTGYVCGDGIATNITLPHNFDDYYGYRQLRHGNLHGSAIYNKMFACEKRLGKRYFLQFEGVGTYATVTLNGREYPKELVGRTVWTLDVTEALSNGENRLSVLVDHPAMQTASPWVCGGCSSEYGFSEGSQPFGIFRPVTLVETDEVRIEPFGVHVWANAACDSVFMETEVKNYSNHTETFELVNKLAEKSGKQVFRLSMNIQLAAGETRVIRQAAAVANVHRWNLDDPYLYTLTTMLKRDGKTTDDVRTPFGIRSISWPRSVCRVANATNRTDNRFRLNDTPVFINGTCEYEHLLGASHAFSHEQIASRIKQIRNAGFNAFREAHQPHNLYYQQLCDEQGMLFWSQFSAHIWYDTPEFRENFKRLLVRWIKERRNSPSVILWGLQNESVLPKNFAEECSDIIRSLDPTASSQRLITTCNGGEGTDWNVIQNWSGTYGGNSDNYAEELSRSDQLLNGEYGAWRTLDFHGTDKYSEESFAALLQKKARLAQQAFHDSLGVCGHFQWLFSSHDNPGRIQPDGALRRIDKIGPVNYKGLLTIWEEPIIRSLTPGPTPRGEGSKCSQGGESGEKVSNPLSPWRGAGGEAKRVGGESLLRINCGGDAYVDSRGRLWQADDSLLSHSWGQDFPGIHPYQASQRHVTVPIHGTADPELFQFFRFGRHRLWYDLPVPDDTTYTVELYFMEPWHGKDDYRETADYEGLRIFDVAINDSLVINDLDPWVEAGYATAFCRTVTARAKNGRLRISFPEVKAGQAVICAIEVSGELAEKVSTPLSLWRGVGGEARGAFWHSLDTDTIAKLPKEELLQDIETRPALVYEPLLSLSSPSHITRWNITPGLGQEYALRFRYKNTTGMTVKARMTLTDAKGITLVDRDIAFPPTPNKFKMLSTTTGTQINAGTYVLTIDADAIEFQNVEIQ